FVENSGPSVNEEDGPLDADKGSGNGDQDFVPTRDEHSGDCQRAEDLEEHCPEVPAGRGRQGGGEASSRDVPASLSPTRTGFVGGWRQRRRPGSRRQCCIARSKRWATTGQSVRCGGS